MSAAVENHTTNHEDLKMQRLRELTKTFVGLEKPLKNEKSIESLNELIAELHKAFESDYVNIEYVNHLLLCYKSKPAEWKKFAKFDRYRYTRNLVDEGNGKFNLIILCWGEGHSSTIHDHADSHCFMKMLQGELTEVRYAWPTKTDTDQNETTNLYQTTNNGASDDEVEYNGEELQEISRTNLELNGVCYINDNLGLHRVENPSNTDCAVSLHLYCPPFEFCSIFNKKTGKRTKCPVTFWSKYGKRTNNE